MTPTQARAFLAVALRGSFSEAARSLRVSQPTVTSQVREIERRYAVELFRRDGRGAELTAVGKSLLPSIQRMFDSFQEANGLLVEVKGSQRGTLRIGSYGPLDVMKIVAHFHRQFPSVSLWVDFANSESLAEKLLGYDLDVAVLGSIKRTSKFHVMPFREPPLIVIAPRTPQWSSRTSVTAAELKNEIIVRRERGSAARETNDRFFEKVKIPSGKIFQFGSRDGVIAAVAEGIGVATIFDEGVFPEDRIVKLKISGSPPVSKIDVVCLAERRSTPLISGFLAAARDVLRAS